MSIIDWAKFVALHLTEARRDAVVLDGVKRDLLGAHTFCRLHSPPSGLQSDYAYGWIMTTRSWAKGPATQDIGRVLTHAGSNTLWYSVAWLAPD